MTKKTEDHVLPTDITFRFLLCFTRLARVLVNTKGGLL